MTNNKEQLSETAQLIEEYQKVTHVLVKLREALVVRRKAEQEYLDNMTLGQAMVELIKAGGRVPDNFI